MDGRRVSIILFAPALMWLVGVAVGLASTAAHPPAWGPVDRQQSEVRGSGTCKACHPAQYETWHQTYHRTMTQRVAGNPGVVQAPFAGETLDALGYRATMSGGPGSPHIRIAELDENGEPGEVLVDAEVAMSVGSHRYQQYVAAIDRGGGPGEYWRLPVAWHIGEARWIHMNTAFVEPEGPAHDPEVYLRHLSRWNDNCILCHNTEPQPGKREDGTFDSKLGEVGIACEACHGPGSAHVARHQNPFRRLLATGAGDASITQPERLDPGRESGVCGRCHGQRIGADIASVLRTGDGFLPGTDLAEVSRPIFADSQLHGMPDDLFADRFWPDETPRLSAYEYQGLLQSPCYQDGQPGGLGCNHCHDMHNGEPNMQVRASRLGDDACMQCHPRTELGGASQTGGHGGHGRSITCLDCHMPRITYGLLKGMISHRIHSPDPARSIGRHDQPDACTQCHVDRSRTWAATNMAGLGLRGSKPPRPPSEEEAWGSRVLLDLHGGDPLQRILAADALTQPRAPVSNRLRATWLVPLLDDEYPSVRWVAWRGLRGLIAQQAPELVALLKRYDPHGDAALRIPIVDQLREHFGPDPVAAKPEHQQALQALQERALISIGE